MKKKKHKQIIDKRKGETLTHYTKKAKQNNSILIHYDKKGKQNEDAGKMIYLKVSLHTNKKKTAKKINPIYSKEQSKQTHTHLQSSPSSHFIAS